MPASRIQEVLLHTYAAVSSLALVLALWWVWAPPEDDEVFGKVLLTCVLLGAASLLLMSAVRIVSDTSKR